MFRLFIRATLMWLAFILPALGGTLTVDMLDIGQGDSILIRGGDKSILIDAGDRSANTAEQLKALGVNRIDMVVSTHPHADHIGGMKRVVESFDIGIYMDNGMEHTTVTYRELMSALNAKQTPLKRSVRGTVIRLGDEASLTVIHPGESLLSGTRSDLNSNSVVLLLEHGDLRMLFTGDAEEPTEHEIVSLDVGDVDLLKVPHHGSGHSSSRSFLAHLKPEIAIISVGEGNRYKHPDPEALSRLKEVNATVYRTDLSGHIRVISDGTTLEVMEGSLQELLGIPVIASSAVTSEPSVPARTSEPAPIQDLGWTKAAQGTAARPSLSEVLESIKSRRAAEKAALKKLRSEHKQARIADKEKIKAAKARANKETEEVY